jgi:hypothetical protein
MSVLFVSSRCPRDLIFLLEEDGVEIATLAERLWVPSKGLEAALDALHSFSCVATDDAWAFEVFWHEALRVNPRVLKKTVFSSTDDRCLRTASALKMQVAPSSHMDSLVDTDLALVLKTSNQVAQWTSDLTMTSVEVLLEPSAPWTLPQAGRLLVDSVFFAEELAAQQSRLPLVALNARVARHLEFLGVAQAPVPLLREP